MKGDINSSNRVLTFDTNQPFQIMCLIQFEPRGQLDDEKVCSRAQKSCSVKCTYILKYVGIFRECSS